MHLDTPVKQPLSTCTPDDLLDTVAPLLWERALEAANGPARPAPRRSDPDFSWLLAEASIPVDVGEHLW